MHDVIVGSETPTTLPTGCGAWLAAVLREQERRAVFTRPRIRERGATGMLAEPCIDRDACADWLATAPMRDRHEAGR